MYSLNIDPNNPAGNPDPAELSNLGVDQVRYTYYDSSPSLQLDPAKADFYRQKAESYKAAGVDSLVILTYDTFPNKPAPDASDADWDAYIARFANRAGQIAQLLKPYSPAYQVWNEPDHPVRPDYSPTLREAVYGRMLRRTYDAIKAVDPEAKIVTAGLASGNPGWLTNVIKSQGGQLPADIVAFHPYGQRPDPDWPNPKWAFGYFGDLLKNYYKAGQNKPIWVTEMGVKEEDLGNNREQVAEFLRRYYKTVTTRYSDKVKELFWFAYSDGMVPSFGLRDGTGAPKPAYNAFRQAIAERPAPTPPPVQIAAVPAPPPPAPPVEVVAPPPPAPAPPVASAAIAQLQTQTNQLQGQVQGLQQQMTSVQAVIQQLSSLLSQLQSQVQQLAGQPVTIPPAPALPVSLPPVPAPPIQNITNQLARATNQQFPTRSLNDIQLIIIHHTAVAPTVGADRIAAHRVQKQGWPGIGYHYFITADGQIQQTNELTTEASHAGSYNPAAIGVCFAGDFTNVIPSPAQIEAGAQLIAYLMRRFNLSIDMVKGYKELVNTQSPGNQWDTGARWGDTLRARVQAYL
jgi:hypothetical protein